ncbi:hypothetical protein LJB42_004351 [Komagataella kurtzmanii]|nr:hypothetical protein LJB42_004351 [Komagataella kurtzmanii]
MSFELSASDIKQTQKSIAALIAHTKKTKDSKLNINLVIGLEEDQTLPENDNTPRIVPVRNRLGKSTEKSILLITKDSSEPYVHALKEKGAPTEDTFARIISYHKLKSLSGKPQEMKKLYHEYDLILADYRIYPFLRRTLGSKFYSSKEKIPFMIQMAKPSKKIDYSRNEGEPPEDKRCDPIYVKKQVISIVKNTFFIPSNKSHFISVVVGDTDKDPKKLAENVSDILSFLTDIKRKPIGGLLAADGIKSLHVRTSESIPLPVRENDEI